MGTLEVRCFTVGAFQENCYLVWRAGATTGILIDPGDEAERLIAEIGSHGVSVAAILLTHTHVDHIGAVAALAHATGAPVYCPVLEREILADIDASVRSFGLGGSRATTPTSCSQAERAWISPGSGSTFSSRPATVRAI